MDSSRSVGAIHPSHPTQARASSSPLIFAHLVDIFERVVDCTIITFVWLKARMSPNPNRSTLTITIGTLWQTGQACFFLSGKRFNASTVTAVQPRALKNARDLTCGVMLTSVLES